MRCTKGIVAYRRAADTDTDFTGSRFWYDAADTASLTLDGSNLVTRWADKSGNAPDFVPHGALAKPIGNDTVNGLNAVGFGTTSTSLILESTHSFSTSGDFAWYAVVETTAASNGSFILQFGSGGQSGQGYLWWHSSLGQTLGWYDTTYRDYRKSWSIGSLVIIGGTADGSNVVMWVNGTEATTTQTGAPTSTARLATLGRTISLDNAILGRYCEIVGFDAAHDSSERAATRAALAAKWGITL